MVDSKITSIPSKIQTALNYFSSTVVKGPNNFLHRKQKEGSDEYSCSGDEPLPADQRLPGVVGKFNNANDLRIVKETNYFAELDNNYDKLLQQYKAYKNPVLDNLTFTPVSEGKLSAQYKGKPVEIKYEKTDDRNKQYEICFDDESKISYTVFVQGSKMEINGEEFEMPAGTILETKSVKGRVFSQLLQTPNMQRKVINMPEIISNMEGTLGSN